MIFKEDEMVRVLEYAEENRNAYRVLMKKSEGKRPLGISRRLWEDNSNINLKNSVGLGLSGSG